MNNIMRIDFEVGFCASDGRVVKGTQRPVCVLYNKTVITSDEVNELIHSGKYEYDDRIVVTTPRQADNLKGNGGE